MTKAQQNAAATLGVALVVVAMGNKVAGRQAAILGLPAIAVLALGWMVSQAIH